ncbi:hypothetical protein M3936_22510 [Sutcliffiella horikoshii]|uniref:hypothetical protein n=1 Tax=Sutcliffiella horikoshii TaxID=79883 RepID=UPI00203D5358|nr:hypothetical protein [Sutcliffiella horikoshii]MCM3620332.1 hypothetical protein [Sutcliffiella horikoshii]
MLKLFKWLIQAGTVPLIIVLVWFMDIRPFTFLFNFVDQILATDLVAKVSNKNIPVTIYGAIDVALLTFFYNLFIKLISKLLKKPALISLKIIDRKSQKSFTTLPFNEETPGTQLPSKIKLQGQIEIRYARWVFYSLLKGVRVTIQWHPKWLSIEPQIGNSDLLTVFQKPGEIHFNFLELLSESDPSTSIDGKLSIMANSNFKRNGLIRIKVEVNSKNSIIRFCFSWLISILIRTDIKPCEIELEKGS